MTNRTKQNRTNRPKAALRVKICPLADAADMLEAYNEDVKEGFEWRQDKATKRARNLADRGKAHLCYCAKPAKAAKKAAKPDDKPDDKP